MTIRLLATVILAASCLLVASCGDSDAPPASRGDNTFRFINRGDIITLDLNQMSYAQDFRIAFAIREGLYTFDAKELTALPALAVGEKISDDKKTWTFTLRDDAKWSNGDPVTAQDFVFSWRHLLESPGQYTYLLHYIDGAKAYEESFKNTGEMSFDQVGIKALDDHTLQVRLENPTPFFRDLMAFPTFYPRHQKSMEPFKQEVQKDGRTIVTYTPDYTRPPHVVTNGPFMLVKWEAGQLLRMEKNPHYWDKDAVKLAAIENVVSNDAQASVIQYDQGRVDWIVDVQQDFARPLKAKGRKDLRVVDAFGTAFITVNIAPDAGGIDNPFRKLEVRRAVSMAIDRNTLVTSATGMGEKPAYHYMPPGFFEGYDAKPIESENIEQAKKLLADAGYPNGEGFPTISLIYNSDNTIRRDLASSISNQLKLKLNINVEPRGIELKAYRDQLTYKNYVMGLAAWYGDYMDPSTFTDKYLSYSENNDSNWGPAEYDRLLADARREPDAAKRLRMLADAETMINQQLPIIPLYYYKNIALHRDNVKNLYTNAKNLTVFKHIELE